MSYAAKVEVIRLQEENAALREALKVFIENTTKAGDLFEEGSNWEAWEWIGAARTVARAALAGAL